MNPSLRLFVLFTLLALGSEMLLAGEVASFSPTKSRLGRELTITYHAQEEAAVLKDANAMTAEVMMMRTEEMPLLSTVELQRQGGDWTGSVLLEDEKVRLLLVRFVSDDLADDNNGNVWNLLVYGDDGKPLEGSHEARGSFLMGGGFIEFKHEKDLQRAKQELTRELDLYPDNYEASTVLWRVMMRLEPGDEITEKVKADLERVYGRTQGDEKALAQLLPWFEQTGQADRADRLRKLAVDLNPKGEVARSGARSKVLAKRDNNKRITLVEEYISRFQPTGSELETMQTMLVTACTRAGELDKAADVLAVMEKPRPNSYNAMAWPLIEKGEDLEKAVGWAKTGVELLRKESGSRKPSYMREKEWETRSSYQLAAILDTYGFGEFKLGRLDEAEKAFEESYALAGGGGEIGEHLAACYLENGRPDKAMAIADELVREGMSSEATIDLYKRAYVAANGSGEGFSGQLADARAYALEEAKKELRKSLVNEPAIDFALKDLQGKTVRLSELRGKVVVLDFWATWCGPCKRSFPYLQKIYDAHNGNDEIAIFAVNTWERVKAEDREATVKKFISENKYTFPVLLDTDVVEEYGVEGIPTKFVIDRNGIIQFKSIGFEGGDKMMVEMDLQFEMLLGDD
ncbi:MAG: redoxin domain-containing protein [Bacteroidota bacterium]